MGTANPFNDGTDLPDPKRVHTGELATVLRSLASIADELDASLVTDNLRLAQYRRVAEIGEWLTTAADSLHYNLDHYANPDEQWGEG
jgi:hypothetical protein